MTKRHRRTKAEAERRRKIRVACIGGTIFIVGLALAVLL